MDAQALIALMARTRDVAERAEFSEICERLDVLAQRLADQKVYVAVLGQFKRGKSTLVNALLGEEVLPSSVVPLTAIPTVLKHGPTRTLEVRFLDDRPVEVLPARSAEELLAMVSGFVSEKANPKNVLNVAQVVIIHPAAVLDGGLVLVDTPGIGSTLAHNTQATINFLPECDAALFVLSPDPPLTQVEREFLDSVRARVSRLYYVLTKSDYVSETDRDELLAFLAEEMTDDDGVRPEIVPVSARVALDHLRNGLQADDDSGIATLKQVIGDFTRNELAAVLLTSFACRLGEALCEMESKVELERGLLTTPVDELESRGRQFRNKLEQAVAERRMAHDLIAGDKRRLLEELESEAQACRMAAKGHLARIITTSDDPLDELLAEAIPPYFERVLGDFSRQMSDRLGEAMRGHQMRADGIIEAVRELASDLFCVDYAAPPGEGAYEARREPYWVTHEWEVSPQPVELAAAEALLPRPLRQARLRKRSEATIDRLVTNNVENIRWAVLQNINDSVLR
ncbi:MAG: dynamin family protein, partial [Coriobacteriia bacterium]|nr:dynamin family protein [Coriobacteriia bacterium]